MFTDNCVTELVSHVALGDTCGVLAEHAVCVCGVGGYCWILIVSFLFCLFVFGAKIALLCNGVGAEL